MDPDVREASSTDMPQLMEWAERFANWSGVDADMDDVRSVLEEAIRGDDFVIFIHDRGFIAGGIAPAWFNQGLCVAEELMWWSDGHGLRLLSAFEQWAIDRRADQIVMIHLPANGERVQRLYQRRGYELTDSKYARSL